MSKINLGEQGFTVPMPQSILGTTHNGKANFMALGWVVRVNFKPPLLAAGVHQSHASHDAIMESGQFSVCFPSRDMVAVTDYVGLVSAEKVDKSGVFDVFYGELDKAPMIAECPLCLECRTYQEVKMPTNTLFLGEIVGTWTEERYLLDGKPDPEKIQPFTLSMPDNRFWALGECVGKAWSEGKALKLKE